MTIKKPSTILTQAPQFTVLYICSVEKHQMNHFDDIQIEESFGFDFFEQDLSEIIDEEHNFSMNEYLNSNYDY